MKTNRNIDRRRFVKISATAVAAAGTAALMMSAGMQPGGVEIAASGIKPEPEEDTKEVFKRCGACSHTFFYILNREFGHPRQDLESASDPLAGGLMLGHQCGMLWGSALAAGAESFRRNTDYSAAGASAITATRYIMDSFEARTGTVICREITGTDLTKKLGIAKMMLKIIFQGGLKNSTCFRLADHWAPEAIQSAVTGLSILPAGIPKQCINCASEVVGRMGGSEEEKVMVAGFAGGMGLKGHACGALGAAIWMDTLVWCRKNPGESAFEYGRTATPKIMEVFNSSTNSEILCRKISGRSFSSIKDHSEFIKKGGCGKVISALARIVNTNSQS